MQKLTTNQKAGGSSPFRRTKITALLRLFMRSDAVIFVCYNTLTTGTNRPGRAGFVRGSALHGTRGPNNLPRPP